MAPKESKMLAQHHTSFLINTRHWSERVKKPLSKALLKIDIWFMKYYRYLIMSFYALAAVFFYWAIIDDYNPVKSLHFSNVQYFTPLGSKIADGISFEQTTCTSKSLTITYTPQFSDDIIFAEPSQSITYKKGCTTAMVLLKVPDELPNGKYVYTISANIPLNPIRAYSFDRDIFMLDVKDAVKGVYEVNFLHE
jgi:hypothetical protein